MAGHTVTERWARTAISVTPINATAPSSSQNLFPTLEGADSEAGYRVSSPFSDCAENPSVQAALGIGDQGQEL